MGNLHSVSLAHPPPPKNTYLWWGHWPRWPKARQGRKPHPSAQAHASETHQVLHIIIIIIIHRVVLFLGHRQGSLISPQEQVLPPHGVSQVKDQVLMGEGSAERTPQPACPLLFHRMVGSSCSHSRGGTGARVSEGRRVGSRQPLRVHAHPPPFSRETKALPIVQTPHEEIPLLLSMTLGNSPAWDRPGCGGYPALSAGRPKACSEQVQAGRLLRDRETVGLSKGRLTAFTRAGEKGTRQAHEEWHRQLVGISLLWGGAPTCFSSSLPELRRRAQ